MKYAKEVCEMFNAFSQAPLQVDQMDDFYCQNTMEYRTSDKYCSPIEDILESCKDLERTSAVLLLGHRGCGKSTELNKMSERLDLEGYPVKIINCSRDLDLLNIVHSDLFILMGEALLNIAKELECKIEKDTLKKIMHFWDEGTECSEYKEAVENSVEAGIEAETPKILSILKTFIKIKADLKYNEETRVEYRRKINVRTSEWMAMLSLVSEEIVKKTGGKYPIIIFEDLDRLNPDDAWKVFYNYVALLSGMKFPVIYTFPIALSYDPKFAAMESYFIVKTLPMIKIATIENQPFENGIAIISEIVEKRANLKLFEEGTLKKMIQYTGGSLRDLFYVINSSAKRAERRKSETISVEDTERALEELKTSLTRRIEKRNYEFLVNIYKGNKEMIEDKEMLLEMLQASVVLEYNGKRWHNLHPLVAKFFEEQGLIADVGE